MVGLVPFVILCIILAVVIITLFAMWHRRDIRKGDPWDADKAAKIYVGLIAGFLVAALGLASTPVVRLDAEAAEASEPPSESTSVLPTSTSEAAGESPTDSVVAAGTGDEIVLTEDHGVDLDTTDRVLLPTDGTPGIDIALYGSPYLYSPAGEVFERTTTEPGESTCGNASDNDTYSDFAVDQWYCFTTSEGVAGRMQVTEVSDRSDSTEAVISYALFR